MESIFEPLLEAMGNARRLVARPGHVSIDDVSGPTSVDICWGKDQHTKALEEVDRGDPALGDVVSVEEVAGALILIRRPEPELVLTTLARQGKISALAAAFLDAALVLGRNALVVGPWLPSSRLMYALVNGGKRAASWKNGPGHWLTIDDVRGCRLLEPDRLDLGTCPPTEASRFLESSPACVSWIDARRLDQALLRYEYALERFAPAVSAQMGVVADLDLLVRVDDDEGIHEIAEIVLAENGYRPNLLFASSTSSVGAPLVPVAAPSFVDELRRRGYGALADEVACSALQDGYEVGDGVSSPSAGYADRSVRSEAVALETTRRSEAHSDPPPPGWELDQLADEDLAPTLSSQASPDDAVMAAIYGLAPPRAPKNVAPTESFDAVLKRMRDDEFSGGSTS